MWKDMKNSLRGCPGAVLSNGDGEGRRSLTAVREKPELRIE